MGGDKYWPEATQLASLVSENHSNVKGMSDRVILIQYSSCEMARNRVVYKNQIMDRVLKWMDNLLNAITCK